MRYVIFGHRSGLKVSEIALGAAMFGETWGYGADLKEVRSIVQGYLEAGGNFIDTADHYQYGESERLVGEAIASNRNDFVLATKFCRGASANPALALLGANRKAMVQSVEESLKRLKTDRIDLYFVHMDDDVTPMEEIARGFDDLARAGKIIYGGLSDFSAWRVATGVTIADLRGWSPIIALQTEYNLVERTGERELLPMADGLGLGVMGWAPLAAGLLTGKYRAGGTGRATVFEHWKNAFRYSDKKNHPVIDALIAIAKEIGANPSQVALAWVRAKGVLPIIGPRTRDQLEDNLASANLKLSGEHVRRLDEITTIPLGTPHELNASERHVMTGNRWDQIDFPTRTVA